MDVCSSRTGEHSFIIFNPFDLLTLSSLTLGALGAQLLEINLVTNPQAWHRPLLLPVHALCCTLLALSRTPFASVQHSVHAFLALVGVPA